MKSFKNLVTEESKDAQIRSMLRSADNDLVYQVKERYYGVGDHMDTLVAELNKLNGETGEFSADLTLAKKMLKLFDKMTLGKYL
jgi:predicted nuclease with TOPRIM domain